MDDLWSRVEAAAGTWEPEVFMADPAIQDPAILEAAIADPMTAAASFSPMAAQFIDIVGAGNRLGVRITIDLDSIILSAAASSTITAAPRAAIMRFRLTIGGEADLVRNTYNARPRNISWQICRWDRARDTPLPPVLAGAEYMYLPAGDMIVLLAAIPTDIPEAITATRTWLFDVLGEFTYDTIQRWTILPRALATLSCDYALRQIADAPANIAMHTRVRSCSICRVHSTNCEFTGDMCESCAVLAAGIAPQ